MAADEDAIFIDDNALAPAEHLEAGRDLVDSARGNFVAIAGVRNRFFGRPPLHFQIIHRKPQAWDWDLSEGLLCSGLSNRSAQLSNKTEFNRYVISARESFLKTTRSLLVPSRDQ